MVQYIYFVKCPNCEDEHFDFFDEAKGFAMGCLSKKPIITQTEVCRNDFGECTDSADLGTVWSWEDVMKDTEEPEASVFSKGDLDKYDPDNDSEFADDDFFAVNELDEAKQGVVEGDDRASLSEMKSGAFKDLLLSKLSVMTKEDLKARLDANEDDEIVLFSGDPREWGKVNRQYFVTAINGVYEYCYVDTDIDNEDDEPEVIETFENIDDLWNYVMEELNDEHSDYYPEFNFVDSITEDFVEESCSRKPVPEGMTIEQLVETMEENEDEVECTWCNDLFPKDMCKKEVNLGYLCSRCADGIMSRGETLTFKENNYWDFLDDEKPGITEGYNPSDKVELYYDDLTITVYGTRRDVDDWDESEYSGEYTYEVRKDDVADTIWTEFITEEDVTDVPGGLDTLEDNDEWRKFLETHFDTLFDKYYSELLDYYREDAADDFSDNYEPDDGPDPDAAYDAWRDDQW